MRLGLVGVILLLGLGACGSSSAAISSQPQPTPGPSTSARRSSPPPAGRQCGPPAARTLAASRLARVYVSAGSVYGCAYASRRSYRLGAASGAIREARVGPVAVAGHDAAYALSSFGIDTGSSNVVVRDLASGRVLHDVEAIHRLLPEAYQAVDAIVVKPDGAVAWISEINSVIRRGAGGLGVLRIDARGQRVLDTGPAIHPKSLRLRGSTLTWRDGARTRSATLV